MTSHASPPSCRSNLLRQSPAYRFSLVYLWFFYPPNVISQVNSSPPQSSASPTGSSADEDDSDDGMSSLSRDGMLNLYFLFIAIAVILLIVALFLIHRRKKRRKEMMRNFGQSALAQDINNPHNASGSARARWLHGGNRWGGPPNTFAWTEEGLNERGEAPPPYYQPPGGPPQPYAPPPNGHFAPQPHVAMPSMPPQQPPPGFHGGDPGLAIPMRTLSRDTQGNKPPGYDDTLQPGGEAGANPISASSSTGNLIRHDGQNQYGMRH